MVKLKAIKYRINSICYLFFLLWGLNIRPKNYVYRFIILIFEFFYYRYTGYIPNAK